MISEKCEFWGINMLFCRPWSSPHNASTTEIIAWAGTLRRKCHVDLMSSRLSVLWMGLCRPNNMSKIQQRETPALTRHLPWQQSLLVLLTSWAHLWLQLQLPFLIRLSASGEKLMWSVKELRVLAEMTVPSNSSWIQGERTHTHPGSASLLLWWKEGHGMPFGLVLIFCLQES